MRTTLHLPDDLYRDVKRIAAEDGRTVTLDRDFARFPGLRWTSPTAPGR